MASVKVKFRASTVARKEGSLYFQLIVDRKVLRIRTNYKIHASEWNDGLVFSGSDPDRTLYLDALRRELLADKEQLESIVAALHSSAEPPSVDYILRRFEALKAQLSFSRFMREQIVRLKSLNRLRTSETYAAALQSFSRFLGGSDIPLSSIDGELVQAYEADLRRRGVSRNTSSFYMRVLRAVYNRAVELRLTPQRHPFARVYTGVDKTVKRAISLEALRRLQNLDLQSTPCLEYVRDLFLLSFFLRGMSFVDMAYLKRSDLRDGVLAYRRKKTGQLLRIRWEPCMQRLVEKYAGYHPDYLLPIFREGGVAIYRQYKNAAHRINQHLKRLGRLLGLSDPLTLYCARHTWASLARERGIPLAIISEGLGHDSETTTRIYLISLDTSRVDQANRMMIDFLVE